SFSPEADAYVDSSLPTTNYGRGLAIRVDGFPTVRSYLRFRVTGAGLPITRALLRVYANSASSSGISLLPVSDNTWSETGITFANAPLPGSQAALSGAVAAGTWKILDVTSLVSGDGLFSFALGTPGSTAISLASRESGANAPQLVLTFPAPAVLLAAGDIARCGGGTSTPAPGSGAQITSDLLLNASGSLFTLGDNSNDSGSLDEYINCFGPTWGRLKDRLTPAMGNHDIIADNQGGPYFSYFGAPAHPESFGHFSLDLGAWHIVVLNAECAVGGQGCGAGSPQETWLRGDLAAHPGKCILAIWHQPLFTSGTQSGYTEMRAFWQALYDYHADIILNGHNHNYERFAPQDPFANSDPANGVREFVVGTGGASLDASSFPLAANEEVRSTAAYGYLKLSLYPGSYTWQFIPQPGSIFTDSGSSTCHQGS
ncbi:MAG TPA: DNRLRE domain-containing protein, partial [Anaerolineaceae bacterium]